MTPIQTNISKVRRTLNKTQTEFGELIDCSKERMASYESGVCHPPLSVIKKIVHTYEIPKEKLWDFIYNMDYQYTRK